VAIERRRGPRRLIHRGREHQEDTRRVGRDRRRAGADPELAEIQQLYRQLAALQFTGGYKRQSPAYRALMVKIRAVVDARTAKRGDEMIVAMEPSDPFGRRSQ
jgi:hypothetical protein